MLVIGLTCSNKATLAIYVPMIYTAPYVMFWMRADYYARASGNGGWALEIKSFLGPVKWHRADMQVPFGAQKTRDFQGSNPLTLAQVMDLYTSKSLCTGTYKSFVHR
jgi:hypothetical protein